jgi:hypothetical protein
MTIGFSCSKQRCPTEAKASISLVRNEMNLDFGKAAISVVSDSAHLDAGMQWVLKRVSSDVHGIVSLKRYRFFLLSVSHYFV